MYRSCGFATLLLPCVIVPHTSPRIRAILDLSAESDADTSNCSHLLAAASLWDVSTAIYVAVVSPAFTC